jgi:hypothetical protein
MARVAHCRSCGSVGLKPILDLGNMPLANGLLTVEQADGIEPTYPLELVFCPQCTLVQITETVPPEVMFSDYPYLSSFSEQQNARDCVDSVLARTELDGDSLVMEVGSNDGTLLKEYVDCVPTT